jgi:tetratricopeptide (TPR) repeat protein
VARTDLAGAATGTASFAVTAGLAFDAGGFHALSWDRALVLLAGVAFALLVAAGGERPGGFAVALLGALSVLTAWTAASWLWSDSPPAALVEAQRTGAYLAAALAVVAAGRRAPLPWVAGGVAAGIVPVACWNLVLRLAPDWSGRAPVRNDIGALADPVGYANGLALLDVLGVLLLLGAALAVRPRPLRALAAALLVPVAADLALQQSDGGVVALGAGLVVLLLAGGERAGWNAVALLALPAAAFAAVAREHGVVAPPPTDLDAAAHPGHRLLLDLLLLAAAQAVLGRLLRGGIGARLRVPARAGATAAALLAVAAIAAAPFALRGHERRHYWRVAVHEIAARPALGSGAGTYVDWWVRTRTVQLSTREAHSLYLETLAELGPVGLLALAVAFAASLGSALRLRAGPSGPPVLAALVAYDVHVAVDFDWELAGVTLPVILLAAAAAVHAPQHVHALAPRARAGAALAAAALAAAGLLALVGTSRVTAAQDAARAGRFGDAISQARRAFHFAPWSAEAWRVIGESQLAEGHRAAARAAFRSAVDLDPADWQMWSELAGVSTGEPRRAALAEAARLNPLGAPGS